MTIGSHVEAVIDAAQLAALYHGDQRYGRHPYIVHPLAVADQVGQRGGSIEQIVAAILHDTVEDTDLTLDVIRLAFGPEVAAIVGALTHDPAVPYAEYVAALPDDAVLVKLCDSICNLHALPGADMPDARKRKLTDRYERNIAVLSERFGASR